MMPQEINLVPEPIAVKMEWWDLDCGDLGVKKITDAQMNKVLEAEARSIKFIKFDDFIVNISFIRGANKGKKYLRASDLRNTVIQERDRVYIIEDTRSNKLLGSQ